MAGSTRSNCLGVVIVALVVGGILIFAVVGLFWGARSKSAEHRIQKLIAEDEAATTLIFKENEIPRFPFPTAGESITREQFVAHMIDEYATDLAKESFRKVASEASVTWKLRTRDIREENGHLLGDFDLPWSIQGQSRSHGSSVNIRCHFTDESRSALLNLRRNDWVTVRGKLSFDGNSPIIKDASLNPKTPPSDRK